MPLEQARAAKRFLGKALKGLKNWELPHVINTDKAPTSAAALAALEKEAKCPDEAIHRQAEYLSNISEADHGKLKLSIRPVSGFKTPTTACATTKGFEVMRALRKGRARIFDITRDIRGEGPDRRESPRDWSVRSDGRRPTPRSAPRSAPRSQGRMTAIGGSSRVPLKVLSRISQQSRSRA